MNEALRGHDVEGRLAIAIQCREPLNRLALLVEELSTSQVTIDSYPKIEEANAEIMTLFAILQSVSEEFVKEEGSFVRFNKVDAGNLFHNFVFAVRAATRTLERLKCERERNGDTAWYRCKGVASQLRVALRSFSDFVTRMRGLGVEVPGNLWAIARPPAELVWNEGFVSSLKGNQRTVADEMNRSGGTVSVEAIADLVGWSDPFRDSANSLKREFNRKLEAVESRHQLGHYNGMFVKEDVLEK